MKTIAPRLRRLGFGLVLASTLAGSAFAHAKLVSADPSDGSVAKAGLSRLQIGFSEAIAAKLSDVVVTDRAGKAVITAPATVDPANPKTLWIATKAPLKAGAYTVAWRAVASDDGHKTTGRYSFTVK